MMAPNQKLAISAFIICQDEERFIERCIRSLAICAEIVVVDSGSTDRTLDILAALTAEGFPIAIFREPWRGYGGQKQFALEQCRQPWCLSIDSDERLSPQLIADLPRLIAEPAVVGWRVTRYPFLDGFGYAPPQAKERFNLRVLRNGAGAFDATDKVHEGLRVTGEVRKAPRGGLLHFRPIQLHEQFLKENKYSSLKAGMKADQGKRPEPWKMLFAPPLYFLRLYFHNGLWRCGWAGFIRAATGGVYAFLTEAKRWETAAIARTPPAEPAPGDLDRY
jgi:glycosyltransferase involved in cell wall biosynthesis